MKKLFYIIFLAPMFAMYCSQGPQTYELDLYNAIRADDAKKAKNLVKKVDKQEFFDLYGYSPKGLAAALDKMKAYVAMVNAYKS